MAVPHEHRLASCASGVVVGTAFGNFRVVSGVSLDGGPLCAAASPKHISLQGGEGYTCRNCSGGVTGLALRYTGPTANISVTQADRRVVFFGAVASGGTVYFTGSGKNQLFGDSVTVWVNGVAALTRLTNCSDALYPGLALNAAFTVVSGSSLYGGELCAPAQVTVLTTCSACTGSVRRMVLMLAAAFNGTAAVKVVDETGVTVYQGSVASASLVEAVGPTTTGAFGRWVQLWLNNKLDVTLDTTCQTPFAPGMSFGSFRIMSADSSVGGRICPQLEPETTSPSCAQLFNDATANKLGPTSACIVQVWPATLTVALTDRLTD